MRQKEELLRESKARLATMESVKVHIDTLMKVRAESFPLFRRRRAVLTPIRSQTATDVQKKVNDLVQQPPTPDAAAAASFAASSSAFFFSAACSSSSWRRFSFCNEEKKENNDEFHIRQGPARGRCRDRY